MTKVIKVPLSIKDRSGKRREVGKDECLLDLKKDLPKMFLAFNKGVKLFNSTVLDFPIESRIRLEAPLLNSCIVKSIQEIFPDNWNFGKYKRFVLRLSDYLILIKKLDKKLKPMNIQTKHVNAISNQLQLSLFGSSDFFTDPILFFGYQKDKFGEINSPQLIYIDEDKIKWSITETEITVIENNVQSLFTKKDIKLTIKNRSKKASNE